ncbi:MAG: hypothetical protein NZ704_14750, partial [Geminicoccaceae bacterium]|nr:hypothetical protein [Geminicoccaceae bacterium]
MITATSTNAASVVPAEIGAPGGARDPNAEGFAVVLAALAAVPIAPLLFAPASAPVTDAPAGVVAPTGGFAAAFLAGARTTEAPLSVPAIPSASGPVGGAPPTRAHDPLSSAVVGAPGAAALDPETLGLRPP